jgi:hypothetical protein
LSADTGSITLNAPLTRDSSVLQTATSDLTINAPTTLVTTAGSIGQGDVNARIGAITINSPTSTTVRGNISAASLVVNSPLTFDTAAALAVNTTGLQLYANAVTLGSDMTFSSNHQQTFPTANPTSAEGIVFAQGIATNGTSGLDLSVNATASTVSFGGSIGAESGSGRFASVSAAGRYVAVGGDIWAQGNITLAPGTSVTGENDFLQFTAPDNAHRFPQR